MGLLIFSLPTSNQSRLEKVFPFVLGFSHSSLGSEHACRETLIENVTLKHTKFVFIEIFVLSWLALSSWCYIFVIPVKS